MSDNIIPNGNSTGGLGLGGKPRQLPALGKKGGNKAGPHEQLYCRDGKLFLREPQKNDDATESYLSTKRDAPTLLGDAFLGNLDDLARVIDQADGLVVSETSNKRVSIGKLETPKDRDAVPEEQDGPPEGLDQLLNSGHENATEIKQDDTVLQLGPISHTGPPDRKPAPIGKLETPQNRADALRLWKSWGIQTINERKQWMESACRLARITDKLTIELLTDQVYHEVQKLQQSLPITATKSQWMLMHERVINKVVNTPDINELIVRHEEAGHKHLHYSEKRHGLYTADKASEQDGKIRLLDSILRTRKWKAYKQSKEAAVETVCLAIDLAYGAGMGQRVLEAMRQRNGWKLEHGVEGAELRTMNAIAKKLTRYDRLKSLDHEQWVAEACIACGTTTSKLLHDEERKTGLQQRIDYALSGLPADANVESFKRAVQVAVLHTKALGKGVWIDGDRLFLTDGPFRDVPIDVAYRAMTALAHRPGEDYKMPVDDFAREVRIAEVCGPCGIDPKRLDRGQVKDAIRKAVRDLPVDAAATRKRASHGAILRVACKDISPKLMIGLDREGYEDLMNSLFGDGGNRFGNDIRHVHECFKLLAGQHVNEETYQRAWEVRGWMDSNYERVRTKVALQSGVAVKSFEGEKVWQSVGIFFAINADFTHAKEAGQASSTDPQKEKSRLAARAHLHEGFERAAEIALLQQTFPRFAWIAEALRASLVNGEHRELPVSVISEALQKDNNPASFGATMQKVKDDQEKWQAEWLAKHLQGSIDKYPSIENLGEDDVQAAVSNALSLLPSAANETQRQRAAEGALIALDLLARVQKARQNFIPAERGYPRAQQLEFDAVIQSLILPGGDNYEVDLALAHQLLKWHADQGVQITLATFKLDLEKHEVQLSSWPEQRKAVRDWVRNEGAANVDIDSAGPRYVTKATAGNFLRGNNDAYARRALAAIHGVSDPFFFFGGYFDDTIRIFEGALERRKAAAPGTVVEIDSGPNASPESTAETTRILDELMTLFIGNPDELPIELCAFFATAYEAVDEAIIDPRLPRDERDAIRQEMRDYVDTSIALRTITPLLTYAKGVNKARSVTLGIPQLEKLIQKVANTGTSLSGNQIHADVARAIETLRDRYKIFAKTVRDRGQGYLGEMEPPSLRGIHRDDDSDDERKQIEDDGFAFIQSSEVLKEPEVPSVRFVNDTDDKSIDDFLADLQESYARRSLEKFMPQYQLAKQRVSRQSEVGRVADETACPLVETTAALLRQNARADDLTRAAEVGIIASALSKQPDWSTEDAKALLRELVRDKGDFRHSSLETVRQTFESTLASNMPMDIANFRTAQGPIGIELGDSRRAWLANRSAENAKEATEVNKRINALQAGVPSETMERVARGVELRSQLLAQLPPPTRHEAGVPLPTKEERAAPEDIRRQLAERPPQRTAYENLSPQHKAAVDRVINPLFDPDGDRWDTDIDTAVRALKSFVGRPMESWDLDAALNKLQFHDAAQGHLQEAIDTVRAECAPHDPDAHARLALSPLQQQEAINRGLSWLRAKSTDAEIKRAIQIGLIEQASGLSLDRPGAFHNDLMRALVHGELQEHDLATVDEALPLLEQHHKDVTRKDFELIVRRIKKRDRIVNDAAAKCHIKLSVADRARVSKALAEIMGHKLSPARCRNIEGTVIEFDLRRRMSAVGLEAGNDFADLLDSCFVTKGSPLKEVSIDVVHWVICRLVESAVPVTIEYFSRGLGKWKAQHLKSSKKVEHARLWMESEVGRFIGKKTQAELQEAINVFMDRRVTQMPELVGKGAFENAWLAHLEPRFAKAFDIVRQQPLTTAKIWDALQTLLDPVGVTQEFADVLLAARGEVAKAPEHLRVILMGYFDAAAVLHMVIPRFRVWGAALEDDDRKAFDRFLEILEDAADPPQEGENRHANEARTAYRRFAESVVKGGKPAQTRDQWLQANSVRIIAEALQANPDLKRVDESSLRDSVSTRLNDLPLGLGLDADDWERVAHGTIIGIDALQRVRKVRPGNLSYRDHELESFEHVRYSLFDPRGKHYGVDLETAQRVLRSFADVGDEIGLTQFTAALEEDKAMRAPLAEKDRLVRAWIHDQFNPDTRKPGLSQKKGVAADNLGWAALQGAGQAHFKPFIEKALEVLDRPTGIETGSEDPLDIKLMSGFESSPEDAKSIAEAVSNFNEVMTLLLGGKTNKAINAAVGNLPSDFLKLYGVARRELEALRVADETEQERQTRLSNFDADLFLTFINHPLNEAVRKNPDLKRPGMQVLLDLLSQLPSEAGNSYPREIKDALDTWRAVYRTFTGQLAARSIPGFDRSLA